jgi:hypothetical protein
MQWSDISFRPAPRTLRQFAGLWLLFFLGWAGWMWWGRGNGTVALVFLAVALLVGPAGLLAPRLVRPIFVGWMCIAFPIGWVVSHLLLACVFYGLFAPLGLFFRLIGRDALALRPRTGQNTYWLPKPMPSDVRRYYRQS